MVNVCVDNDDFDVVGGRLELKTTFVQSAATNFTHVLDGATDVPEQIGELASVIIATAGWYLVNYAIHGNATITPAAPGISVSASAAGYLYRNGVLVPNTETRVVTLIQGAPTPAGGEEPALQSHATGSGGVVVALGAGDTLQIWGSRNSDPGTTTQILSSGTGRTRISALRLGGI